MTIHRRPLAWGLTLALIFALATMLVAPAMADRVGTSTFNGLVQHVSTNNIKVYNPRDKSTVSFLILPKFDQLFSEDGKTTYQMAKLHNGQYVKVFYDQKALGARHADRILILNNASQQMGRQ